MVGTKETSQLKRSLVMTCFAICIAASPLLAQNDETQAKIQYDLLLLEILENSGNESRGVRNNKMFILPNKHQGDYLKIEVNDLNAVPKSLLFEIHDMSGQKILSGLLPENRLIDISSLPTKLHVVTINAIDSLMQFNLVVSN